MVLGGRSASRIRTLANPSSATNGCDDDVGKTPAWPSVPNAASDVPDHDNGDMSSAGLMAGRTFTINLARRVGIPISMIARIEGNNAER